MILQAFVFAGGWVLVLALLSLAPRWVQRWVLTLAWAIICALLARAAMDGDSGLALAAIILGLLTLGLDAVLRDLRRARPVDSSPREAPGAPLGAGDAGKRARSGAALSDSGGSAAGERDAPSLPGMHSTAGRAAAEQPQWPGRGLAATRPRSVSKG